MAAGDLTVTATAYATLALAVAAMDAENLPAATDRIELHQTPGAYGASPFVVVKIVRAAA